MFKQLRLVLRFSLLLAVAGLFSAPKAVLAATPEIIPGEFTVVLRPGNRSAAAEQTLLSGAGRIVRRYRGLNAVRLKLNPGTRALQTLQLLRLRGDVVGVEPVLIVRAVATPNDPEYGRQYALPKIQAPQAWDIWRPIATIRVAIIDTGVDTAHPDLAGMIDRTAGGQIVGFNVATNSSDASDDNGHGTHVAGSVAARINNQVGVAGVVGWNPSVPNAETFVRLQPVKVLNDEGVGTDVDVAAGIVWAADHGAHVLNLSLGTPGSSQVLQQAMRYAAGKGCVIVAAAGNDGVPEQFYPAAYPEAISVGATNSSDRVTDFSNYGTWVKIAAPGNLIYSTLPGNTYGFMNGTSMAAPHVAGVAASILAQYPALTPSQVETSLLNSVDPYQRWNGRGFSPTAGRLNARRALEAAGDFVPAPVALSLAPAAVTGGNAAQATVTLSMPAGSGGLSVMLTSDSAVASVPATVSIPAGQSAAQVSVGTQAVSSQQRVTLTASANGRQSSSVLTVEPPTLTLLQLQSTAVVGGAAVAGSVILSAPAPQGGLTVPLSADVSIVSVPVQVTVAGGAVQAGFNIDTQAVTADRSVIIRAKLGTTEQTERLLVQAPTNVEIGGLSLKATSVKGGNSTTGTVTLNRVAPSGGATVALSVDNAAASVPATVQVPAGALSATFPVNTMAVADDTQVRISGALGGATASVDLVVTALPIKFKLTRNRAATVGGVQLVGTIRLTRVAPAGGVVIGLASDNPAVTVPTNVTIEAGQRAATFAIETVPVAVATAVTITGQRAGNTARARIRLQPPKLMRVTLAENSVSGGASVAGTVALNAPAPQGGLVVALRSNFAGLTVPETVVIPAGATETGFQVQTAPVTRAKKAKLTARLGKQQRNVAIRVVP